MSRLSVFPVLLLTGCVTGVPYVAPSAPSNVALLEVGPIDAEEHPFATGISNIEDTIYFAPPYPRSVFLAPGSHRIGFNCTQVVTTGGPPVAAYKFVAGMTYHLKCLGNIPIVSVGPASGPN